MEVVCLKDDSLKDTVVAEWEKSPTAFEPSAFVFIQEALYSGNGDWYGVRQKIDGTTLAIFDVKKVPAHDPAYHKTLHIHFSPNLDLSGEWKSIEELNDLIKVLVNVLMHAFQTLIEHAEATKEKKCRVYCEHPNALMIIREFVWALAENQPDKFESKIFGKWVELKKL